MQTIIKVLDELGMMILDKNNKIKLQQKEISKLKKKIETIEYYLDMYEENCNYEIVLKNRR